MRAIVKAGTRGSESPCETCKYFVSYKGTGDSQEVRTCGPVGGDEHRPHPFYIIECNQYVNRLALELYEMKAIAWLVDLNPKKKYGLPGEKVDVEIIPPNKRDENTDLRTVKAPYFIREDD